MASLRHLGPFSDLVPLARRQRGLFPAGPQDPAGLAAAARHAIGVLDLRPGDVRVERRWIDGELAGEEVSWSVGFGPRTHGYVLRPRRARVPLPGIVALHCHAGVKHVGKEKIADGPTPPTAEVRKLRERLYGGRAWANALALRGFVVLAHDVFCWGSRRFPAPDMPEPPRGLDSAGGSAPHAYDVAAARHEHVVEKYCTLLGTSLAGVVAGEDMAAAGYLRSRPDVSGVGCAGLSGGGLRAALLGAFDPAIRAVAVVAMISSYRDLLDGYVATHTWMLFPPGLTRVCDLPDLVAARAPAPLLVLYGAHDPILPLAGMRRAHARIADRYRAAGRAGGYTGVFADAPHRFDLDMQETAFDWLINVP